MPSLEEMTDRLNAIQAARASGTSRVSYNGQSIDYRSLNEMDRIISSLKRDIAALDNKAPRRVVRFKTSSGV